MYDWTKHKGWIHRRKSEVRFLLFNKLPRRFLCESFAGTVAIGGVLDGLLSSKRVPVLFTVRVLRPVALEWVDNRGEGRSDDDALDAGCRFLDRLQDAGGANDGRVEQFLESD